MPRYKIHTCQPHPRQGWRDTGVVVEQPTAGDAIRHYAGGLALRPEDVQAERVLEEGE